MRLARWAGPVLALAGIAALGTLALLPAASRGLAGGWVIATGLAPGRLLALVGFGLGLGLSGPRMRWAGFAAWAAGLAAGFAWAVPLMALIQPLPGAVTHQFLTLPVALFASGVMLIGGARLRPLLLVPAAPILGAATALGVKVTDPSYDGALGVTAAGAALGLWLLAGVALSVAGWRRPWMEIASRIVGSWLVAIGLLFGATAMMPPRLPTTAPAPAAPAASGAFPEFGPPPTGRPTGRPDTAAPALTAPGAARWGAEP